MNEIEILYKILKKEFLSVFKQGSHTHCVSAYLQQIKSASSNAIVQN